FEYLPFGGSNRRCIGMAFAQYEMKLALATLLSEGRFESLDRDPVQAVRRGVTMARRGALPWYGAPQADVPSLDPPEP
ncbi:MAG: cytochrome P450, partial [Synechococcales cyanobacterium RM1_1_8]|nr:cytochrome P450 [Synechococcales cyanobacterium RM1_1_8]